jgi:hypothetical protein
MQDTHDRLVGADNAARAELRKLRREVETVAADDVAAYAAALAAGETPPKARAAKIKDRIRDLELRVVPGIDEALWHFVTEVREGLRPNADDDYRRLLDKELPRWQPPDTGRRDQPTPPQHLKPRPRDIVQWVEDGIGRVDRFLAEAAEGAGRKERQKKAGAAMYAAEREYDREQRERIEAEEADMTPLQRNNRMIAQQTRGSVPWPPFDRRAWLEANGLLEDYGWTQGGGVIEVKGGRQQKVEFVPASDLQPASTEA